VVKLPLEFQKKYIFSRTGAMSPYLVKGSGIGEDAAVIKLDDSGYLITHTDPITDAVKFAGKLAVQVSSNDIAVKGARPAWSLVTFLLPTNFSENELDELTSEVDLTSRRLGIAIAGGHTEYTSMINRPIISITQIGIKRGGKPVDISSSKPGNVLIMINEAAIEGTAVLALDREQQLVKHGVSMATVEKSTMLIDKISIIDDALTAAELGADAMHDPTEGGVIGAMVEMALASGLEIEADPSMIRIRKETSEICSVLGLNPLALLSSGALLVSASSDKAEVIKDKFRKRASIIGKFKSGNVGLTLKSGPSVSRFIEPPADEISRL
jgi:hydrogenase maturation factor